MNVDLGKFIAQVTSTYGEYLQELTPEELEEHTLLLADAYKKNHYKLEALQANEASMKVALSYIAAKAGEGKMQAGGITVSQVKPSWSTRVDLPELSEVIDRLPATDPLREQLLSCIKKTPKSGGISVRVSEG